MPCRSCPGLLERAITSIDEVQRNTPELLPQEFDYEEVKRGLAALATSVREELIRQGRWR